jgi:hypothetical protein
MVARCFVEMSAVVVKFREHRPLVTIFGKLGCIPGTGEGERGEREKESKLDITLLVTTTTTASMDRKNKLEFFTREGDSGFHLTYLSTSWPAISTPVICHWTATAGLI